MQDHGSFRDDGPGAGGGYIIDVKASARVEVNGEWRYRVSGLKDMHSLLVELYGANGGLFRLFPRGRDVMEHAIIPNAPGRTTVMMIGRDAMLRPLVTISGTIDVAPKGAMGGPGAGGGYYAATQFGPLTPMGLSKPPFASENVVGGFGASQGQGSSQGMSSIDAMIEAKKAELEARMGKR